MDPLSITTACIGLVGSIANVSIQISDFVRGAREARGDLDLISRELVSLKTLLDILSEDARTGNGFTESLAKNLSGILESLGGVLKQIEVEIQKHAGGSLGPAVKWSLSGREEANKLRSSLEVYKSTLEIVLDMVSM